MCFRTSLKFTFLSNPKPPEKITPNYRFFLGAGLAAFCEEVLLCISGQVFRVFRVRCFIYISGQVLHFFGSGASFKHFHREDLPEDHAKNGCISGQVYFGSGASFKHFHLEDLPEDRAKNGWGANPAPVTPPEGSAPFAAVQREELVQGDRRIECRGETHGGRSAGTGGEGAVLNVARVPISHVRDRWRVRTS